MLPMSFVSLCHLVDNDKRYCPFMRCFSMRKEKLSNWLLAVACLLSGLRSAEALEWFPLLGWPEVEGCVSILWCLIWKYRGKMLSRLCGLLYNSQFPRLLFTWAWLGRRTKPNWFVEPNFFSGFSSVICRAEHARPSSSRGRPLPSLCVLQSQWVEGILDSWGSAPCI